MLFFKSRDLLTVYPEEFNLTIRPVLIPYNFDTFLKKLTLNKHGTYEMLYGKYPQFVDVTFSKEITYHFYHGKKGIQSTDRYFTINYPTSSNNKAFIPKRCPIYQYKKREFISVQANHSNYFTNGDHFEKDNYYWVEVTPITWLVDLKNKLLVSKYGLISGIRLKDNWNYDGNFNHTDIKYYLDKHMKEEITSECKIGILDNDQELQDIMLKRSKIKKLR